MDSQACTAALSGWIEGDTWTRWKQAGEGQVRFWLRPLHASAGLLLCAVPVRGAKDLREAEEMLVAGRHAELVAAPVSLLPAATHQADEQAAGVVFLAREGSTVGGFPLRISEREAPAVKPEPLAGPHAVRAVGKAAAAGEHEGDSES